MFLVILGLTKINIVSDIVNVEFDSELQMLWKKRLILHPVFIKGRFYVNSQIVLKANLANRTNDLRVKKCISDILNVYKISNLYFWKIASIKLLSYFYVQTGFSLYSLNTFSFF